VGSPVVSGDLVLVGSSDGNLYAFDVTDLSQRWAIPTGDKVWSAPAVAGGVAYFGSLDHKLYAVSLETGDLVWDSPFEANGAITATPVIANGRVYVGAFDSVFYAIDAETGREVGRFEGASRWFWGGAVATEDTIYAPSLDGNLYALDIDTLSVRGTFKTDGPIIGSPVIVGDRIAVPSIDGRVWLVSLQNLDDAHFCDIEDDIRASLTAHDGVIFLAAKDHSIRALEAKQEGKLRQKWLHFTNDKLPDRTPFCL